MIEEHTPRFMELSVVHYDGKSCVEEEQQTRVE